MDDDQGARAQLRWVRASVLGAAALLSGAVAHLAGGGRLPGAAAMAVLLLGSVLIASRLLTSWAGPVRLVAFVVLAQGVVHGVLSVLAGHRGDPSATTLVVDPGPFLVQASGRPGTLQDVYEAGLAQTPTPGAHTDVLSHQWAHLVEQGPWMALAHVAGAVALGVFLAFGERSLSTLLMLLVAVASAWVSAHVWPLAPTPLPTSRRMAPAGRWRLVRASQLLAPRTRPLRGPPVLLPA